MSAYPAAGGYSPHLQPNNLPHHPNAIQTASPGGHHPDPLSAHAQHGVPIAHPSYQYDHPGPHQLQPYNGHANGQVNGHGHGHGHGGAHNGGDVQMQQRQPSVHPATPTSGGEGQKGNRLRKACDSCSIRKVKCDESGPPCRACAALEIPCTFDRPSRRRGPPNKHAEAIKKRKLEESPSDAFSTPTSPNNVAETLASFSSHAVLNAESICPIATLELLVDDFFTYIHPLCPFPHEPSFRHAFKDREDLRNPNFLALLASMIGALVASFPRKPRQHLKSHNREHLFPNSVSFVDRCHKVAVEARGSGYLDKVLDVYSAVTSYFLGLAGAYTFRWKQTRLYFGETLTITRVLGAHKLKDPGLLVVGALPAAFGGSQGIYETQPQNIDIIRQEIGRRVFWVMFVGIGSIQQLGSSFGELLMPPNTPSDPYPPFPLEVDDEYLFESHFNPQPAGIVSKLTGFNLNVQVYLSTVNLSRMELAYGIDEIFDWARQKRVLEKCLEECKTALEQAPPELRLLVGSEPGTFANSQLIPQDARRSLQFEIQKANIYASQLGTRSYIVEKYCNLKDLHDNMNANAEQMSSPGVMARGLDAMLPKTATSNGDGPDTNVLAERDSIVKDLLGVLRSINQQNMEPNGGSFINKIRQIASTLIETPQSRKGPTAIKAEEYLKEFLDVLMKLERTSPGFRGNSVDGVVNEDEELSNWADMREYQMKFAQAGGFMNEMGS